MDNSRQFITYKDKFNSNHILITHTNSGRTKLRQLKGMITFNQKR